MSWRLQTLSIDVTLTYRSSNHTGVAIAFFFVVLLKYIGREMVEGWLMELSFTHRRQDFLRGRHVAQAIPICSSGKSSVLIMPCRLPCCRNGETEGIGVSLAKLSFTSQRQDSG